MCLMLLKKMEVKGACAAAGWAAKVSQAACCTCRLQAAHLAQLSEHARKPSMSRPSVRSAHVGAPVVPQQAHVHIPSIVDAGVEHLRRERQGASFDWVAAQAGCHCWCERRCPRRQGTPAAAAAAGCAVAGWHGHVKTCCAPRALALSATHPHVTLFQSLPASGSALAAGLLGSCQALGTGKERCRRRSSPRLRGMAPRDGVHSCAASAARVGWDK